MMFKGGRHRVLVIAAVLVVVTAIAFFVGRGQRSTMMEAQRAAFRAGQKSFAAGSAIGLQQGRRAGTLAGQAQAVKVAERAARRNAAKAGTASGSRDAASVRLASEASKRAAREQQVASAPAGPSESNVTPSVNSPEGQRLLQETPECRAHPPPPGYEGPVQC